MKKIVLALTTLALTGATMQTAQAGDREWATAGKILTGVFAGSVLTRAFEPAPVYAYPTTTYVTPTVCAPAPVYVQPAPVYVQPSPVYVSPAPVYVQPAPMVVYPQPVYVRPAPVISFRFGFGGGYGYRGGGHHRYSHHRF